MKRVYELREKTQGRPGRRTTKRVGSPRGAALAIEVGKCEPFFMSRHFLASSGAVLFLMWSSLPAPADSIELKELRELRQMVEQQSKQIEALSQQVSKLHEALDHSKSAGSPAPAPAPAPAATSPEHSAPASAPSPATANPPAVEVPRAEAVPKHTVAKGETLTSIAKLYNITVTELQKLNKIENDRKLQIGQTLTIPSPKPTDTTTEKKENP
jgi:LysM repeat protein